MMVVFFATHADFSLADLTLDGFDPRVLGDHGPLAVWLSAMPEQQV